MKKFNLSVSLAAMLLFVTILSSCSSSNDSPDPTTYSNVSVTVVGSDYLGYRLYTDFGVILNPTNINQLPQLKEVNRAFIGFTFVNESLTLYNLEEGNTYDISLIIEACEEIPSFTQCIDTSSRNYQENGQDSIATRNQMVTAINAEKNQFYVKNGYLNTIATFRYGEKPVCFLLYYNGTQDVNAQQRELILNLYYNTGTTNPLGPATSPLSFKLSPELYAIFKDASVGDNETIDVRLKASTIEGGNTELHYEMKLTDLLLP